MKSVIHITNELTYKNYSISSIILYLRKKLQKKKISSTIITNKIEAKIISKSECKILKINYLHFFSYFSFLKKKKNSILFLHGIWSSIQIMTIIISIILQKKILIHPHGMFLKEALRDQNILKYFVKRIFLLIIKFFIKKNFYFVSSTNKEMAQIKFFFPKTKSFKIWNPYPFKKFKINTKLKKKKNFVFFGRINQHKNILLLINSFIAAKLGDDWKLKIYGISDDLILEKEILKISKINNNIQILKPVFEKKKINIINSSWLNVLVSKSEILSLSILEAYLYGLPSLISKNFNFEISPSNVFQCDNNVLSISKKFRHISNWSESQRKEIQKKIISNFNIKKYNDKIINQYLSAFNKID